MSSGDFEEKVLEWLSKQGHPFELQVGRVFNDAGWYVDHSRYYEDPVTMKVREVDLLASFLLPQSESFFTMNIVVECKSSKEKPWIVLGASKWYPQWSTHVLPGAVAQACVESYYESHKRKSVLSILTGPKQMGHGVLRAFHESKGNDPSSAYSAVQTVVNAAATFSQRSAQDLLLQVEDGELPSLELYLPVVVTDAPVFSYSLNAEGVSRLKAVGHSCMLSPHPIKADELMLVYIVNVESLSEFVTLVANDMGKLSHFLDDNVEALLQRVKARTRQRVQDLHLPIQEK